MRCYSSALVALLLPILGTTAYSQLPPTAPSSVTNQTAEARALLNQAKTSALRIADRFQRDELIDQIGAAQAKAGDLEAAVDSANRSEFHASATFKAVGEALAELNDLNRARLLGRKLKNGKPSFFFSDMALSQAKKGRINEALNIIEQIPFLETRSYALEKIAIQQAVSGDDSGARKTLVLARTLHEKGLVSAEELEMATIANRLSRGEEQKVRATIAAWEPDRKFAAKFGGAEQLRQQGDKLRALAWVSEALSELPAGSDFEFFRYYAIPILVHLGEEERATELAAAFSGEMRVKAFMAVAVTCAEEKNTACVESAVERMRVSAKSNPDKKEISEFVLKTMMLSVSAALIDHGQWEQASRLLATVEDQIENIGWIKPRAQLQRVLMLAQRADFEEARTLALKIRPDSITEFERGNALRITAMLQTRKQGSNLTRQWASPLTDNHDRAYVYLGIAQALVGIDEVKLRPRAILIH